EPPGAQPQGRRAARPGGAQADPQGRRGALPDRRGGLRGAGGVTAPAPLEVPASAAGRRVDLFVSEALGLSRARVKRLFEEGAVRVDGRPARKGDLLRAGQRVEVRDEALVEGPPLVPEPSAPLSVLHEDADLVFTDKPSGS